MSRARSGFIAVALTLWAGTAPAQGIVVPAPNLTGAVATAPVTPARVRIAAEVSERAARVHVDETFHNPYDRPLEGTFVLALPAGAVVSEFAFHMNGKRIPGELLDRARAREVYESIVQRYRDPALLEWADRTLVRLSLFPIPPRGEGRVEVIYAQVLPADAGLIELVLPLRAPASAGATADVATAIELSSDLPFGNIYSPSHRIDVSRRERGLARVTFEDPHLRLDRDLLLAFAPAEKGVGVSLLGYRPAGEDGTFLLLATPDESAAPAENPAKDVVFVLDTSGSMREDDKLAKARRALVFGLRGLGRDDRFGLVTFATEARAWRETLTAASPDAVASAVARLEQTEATGGTAIAEALAAGFALLRDGGQSAGRPRYLVFLTDGLPTIGESDPARIASLVAGGAGAPRLFPFGVGFDVNAPLLDDLARRGRGRSQYVRPAEDLEVKVSSFFRRMQRPVLTDLKLAIAGVEVRDLHPAELPDLFAGDDLVVAGRYRGDGAATVTLSGRLRGQAWSTARPVRFPARADDRPHLAVIWAERRIGYLLEQIRLNGETLELKDEVIRLARAHGLVTPYTSYLVSDEPAIAERRPAPRLEASARRSVATTPAPSDVRGLTGGWSGGVPSGVVAPSAAPEPIPDLGAAAGTEASLDASEAIGRQKEQKTAAKGIGVRTVRGHRFTLTGGIWVDDAYRPGVTREERVEAFSARYFELVRARPELGDCFALGERVLVVVEGVAYRVEPRTAAGPSRRD